MKLNQLIFGFFVAFVLLIALIGINLFVFIKSPSELSETKTVTIERGMRLAQIIEALHNQGVIGNIPLFRAYILFKGNAAKIHAGEYIFQPRMTPAEVLDQLMKGDFATRRVTIPEGWTIREVAAHLQRLKLVDADRFVAKCHDPVFILSLGLPVSSLEGYLFPDTYEIYKPKDEEEVIRKLVGHFREIYAKEFEARMQEVGMTEQDVVNLASIVEKETANKAERPLIAGVFLNRLKIGMPLATDPSVIYGIPNFNGNITKQDLLRPGPYNTYLNAGLPPTPIANPGRESLHAVLYPAPSEYLYFVSKNDGTHFFSKTEAEHNEAVKKYQLNRSKQTAETLPESAPVSY